MERIFTDKILAAEFYYQRKMLFDTAKHLYDLAMLMEQERIQKLLANPEEMTKMLAYKRREEEIRIGSDLAAKPFSEFEIFPMIERDQKLLDAFQKMQSIYVFSKEDVLLADIMSKRIEKLAQSLLTLNENLGNTSRAEIPAQ